MTGNRLEYLDGENLFFGKNMRWTILFPILIHSVMQRSKKYPSVVMNEIRNVHEGSMPLEQM